MQTTSQRLPQTSVASVDGETGLSVDSTLPRISDWKSTAGLGGNIRTHLKKGLVHGLSPRLKGATLNGQSSSGGWTTPDLFSLLFINIGHNTIYMV